MRHIYRLAILILSYMVITPAFSSERPLVRYADRKFRAFDFSDAVVLYERAYRRDTSVYLVKQIADCYRLLNDPVHAEPYYKKLATDKGADPINKLYYAETLRSNKKYAAAIYAYQSYLDYTHKSDASVQERIEGLKRVDDLQKDKGFYYLQDASINSPNSDFGASYYIKNSILFSSNRDRHQRILKQDLWTGAGFLKIYTTTQSQSTALSEPVMLKAKGLNKGLHEGPAAYDKTRNELYFTRCNQVRRNQDVLRLKLYKATVDTATGKLGKITEAVPFNGDGYSVMHPSISDDGTMLFFASDMNAKMAQGGMDLYVCRRAPGGDWGEPENLGTNINTNGDEMFPFIAPDSTLYFASNGHAGLGGLDIYMSFMLDNGKWSKPHNLGYPINTNYDDFGYIIDSNNANGFFASNRPGGQGDDDIYKFTRRGGMVYGQIFDAVSLEPIDAAEISLKENDKILETQNTMSEGDFCFALKDKHYYTLPTFKPGYVGTDHEVKGSLRRQLYKVYLLRADTVMLDISVRDSRTKRPIGQAEGMLTDISTGREVPFVSDDEGMVHFIAHAGNNYKVEVMQKNAGLDEFYFGQVQNISTVQNKGGDHVAVTFDLISNNINTTVDLKNIYFDLDKWAIRPDAKRELGKIVKIMKEHPTWEIVVSAHTDCRNTYDYNMGLSAKRALSVVNYLVSKGIPSKRMIAIGYGEMQLVNKCSCEGNVVVPCTEKEHAVNRRIEFRINKL